MPPRIPTAMEIYYDDQNDVRRRRGLPPYTPPPVPGRLLAAARSRNYRARQRTGAVALRLDVALDVIAALIEAGYISEGDALDPKKLAAALGAVLGEWARRWAK